MATTNDRQRSIHEFDEPKLRALVHVMFLAAYADGEFSQEEREHFAKSVESLTDRKVAGDDLDKLIAEAEVIGASEGEAREAKLEELRTTLGAPAACKVALELAIQVMAADGIVRTSEREVIMELADGLRIDRDEAADLVKRVM